jgi:MFS family permease
VAWAAGRHATFASLRIRNYRLFASSQLLSNTGSWVQRIAQDWLVLTLTDSPLAVAITTAMQFAPLLLFGLYGGVIADRYPKRSLLLVTQTIALLLAAVLAVLSFTHAVTVWQVWVIAFALGLDTVVDNPTRQAFVNDMVGPANLRNAISLNSSTFQLGALIGPALSGLLINVFGLSWAFAINAASFVPVLATLVMIDQSQLRRTRPVPRTRHQLRDGLSYVRRHRELMWPIVLAGFVGSIGLNMPIVLSVFAKDVFHSGAGGYGLLSAMVALGSVAGALRSASRPASRLRSIVVAAGVFGLIEAATAVVPNAVAFAVLLVAVGAAALTFQTSANSTVQINADDDVRGRVMGLYMLVCIGGQPIGGLLTGFIAEHLGVRAAMFTCGFVPALAAAAVAVMLAGGSGRRRMRWRPAVASSAT